MLDFSLFSRKKHEIFTNPVFKNPGIIKKDRMSWNTLYKLQLFIIVTSTFLPGGDVVVFSAAVWNKKERTKHNKKSTSFIILFMSEQNNY